MDHGQVMPSTISAELKPRSRGEVAGKLAEELGFSISKLSA